MASLLIKNIQHLIGLQEGPSLFKKGRAMAEVESVSNAFIFCVGDKISSYGPMSTCPDMADGVIDANNGIVLPSWCDSHTHLVFAASREEEFVYRIKGMSYSEIAEKGGGILNSAAKLQKMDEGLLYELSAQRLEKLIRCGTGAIEIKSGYGLTLDAELKILRVIRRLKENYPVNIKSTFLGAHAIPTEFKQDRQGYIELIIEAMLPKIAEEGLADYCDVFCDKGFFTVEETSKILEAGLKFGLKPKIHANQLAVSGGVQVGIAHKAISVDHLEEIGEAEILALRETTTIPTLLPSCSYFLNIPYAPARRLIDEGLGIALATDFNPGTSPSGNMPFLLSLACTQMKLLPEEAFNAVTINGACAMEIQQSHGSIAVGKTANLIVTKPMSSLAYLPYAFGDDHIKDVILNGELFH